MAGNISLDVGLVGPNKLTIAPTLAEKGTAPQLLRNARQRNLWVLEINPSYGADCVALFKTAEILPNHVLFQITAHVTK
jgi:hypothetical protein